MTQQAGDIDAAYEQLLIDAREAELTTIRAEVDRRVAAAEAILREIGSMRQRRRAHFHVPAANPQYMPMA
ncbi:MAG: hypothetical protein LBH76_03305 [Propionibacteriaceae bacterium]|nr:hypothetical protein [Propionibacteriaceae bacterium]